MASVIPGASGYALNTRAAYGGSIDPSILRVTNLDDSGSGSLRDALLTEQPRVIVFEISGSIILESDIIVTSPFVTLAGQTAPSPGITVQGFGIQWYTHDVLMQHMRIRPGDGPPLLPQTADHDGSIVYTEEAYNIVFDHNSISWAQGKLSEVISIARNAEICYWRNILSEALYRAKNVTVGEGEPSSLCMLLKSYDDAPMYVSVLGNLFAHNADRNPEIQNAGVTLQFVNNIVYDWGRDENPYNWATFLYECRNPTNVAIVGNKYIVGQSPHPHTPLYAVGEWNCSDGTSVYLFDNTIEGAEEYDPHNGDHGVESSSVDLSNITIRLSSEVEDFIVANAGARPSDRDSVDERVIDSLIHRTGEVISSQDEWPVLESNIRSFATPNNPHAYTGEYTNLELILHDYAAELEGAGEELPVIEPTDAIGFDYPNLAVDEIMRFEVSWDGQPFELLEMSMVELPDTEEDCTTYKVVPPFTSGTHVVAFRAFDGTSYSTPSLMYQFMVEDSSDLSAPRNVRKVPR
jgi:hypothetical protein